MIASEGVPSEALSGFVNSIHSIRFSRFPPGAMPPGPPRVPAWRKIEYYLALPAESRTFLEKFLRPARGMRARRAVSRGDGFEIIRNPGALPPGNFPAHRMPTTPAGWSIEKAGPQAGLQWATLRRTSLAKNTNHGYVPRPAARRTVRSCARP